MDITEAFELVDDISEYDLKKNGFRDGTYKCFVYKDMLQLLKICEDASDGYCSLVTRAVNW